VLKIEANRDCQTFVCVNTCSILAVQFQNLTMKKILLVALMTMCFGFIPNTTYAQTAITDNRALVWGASPFQDSLWAIDTATLQVVYRLAPSLPSFTITGCTGLATDPTTGITYVIMKVSAVSGRVLGTIDLMTGVCTQIGNLGDNFSSITFREDGQLFGMTGDGATVPETLYLIDKLTGNKTVAATLSAGADGEIICYNRANDLFYHWSGNGTVVFESVLSVAPYTATNIPTSGAANGETFGAMYISPSTFWRSNISSAFNRQTTAGVYSAGFGSNPDDLRGLVMLPYFTMSDDTICQNETLSLTGGGHMLYDNFIYHWGDGNSDTLAITNGVLTIGSHMYAAAGNYTVQVETDNGSGGDTVYTFAVRVNSLPIVAISGFSTVCSGDSITLTASSGGTSQWYMNGVLIPGATTNVYSTDQPGVYNMIKTNLNGCFDSAAVGTTVIVNSYPVVAIGPDTANCVWYVLDAGNAGSTYAWSDGDTTQMDTVMSSGQYTVIVTNVDGCASSDTVNVIINPLPVVNIGADTSDCVSVPVDAGNPGASYLWCDGSTTQTVVFTTSTNCSVVVTDSNGCSASDTINITIFGNPTVSLSAMMDSMCATTPPIVLMGSPSGGTFSGPGVSPNTFTPSIAGAGVHTALYMYTDTNGCSGSDSTVITVFANPTVTASASSSTVCADDANVTLTGSPAGGTFSGTSVTGNQFDPSVGAGNYTINYNVTDANGCSGSATTSVQVNACVGIEETNTTGFTMYPNPSTGLINFTLMENSTVEIFDVLGNAVTSKQFYTGAAQIDLSNQPNGVYFVRVNGTNAQRLVIQK
jgi:hypothetical protein